MCWYPPTVKHTACQIQFASRLYTSKGPKPLCSNLTRSGQRGSTLHPSLEIHPTPLIDYGGEWAGPTKKRDDEQPLHSLGTTMCRDRYKGKVEKRI